jgi:hypothetical protein
MSSRKRKQIEPKQIDSEEEVLLEKIQSEYDNMMRQTHVCCCSIYAHGLFNKKFNKYINQVQAEARSIFYSLILPGMCNFRRPVDEYNEISALRKKATLFIDIFKINHTKYIQSKDYSIANDGENEWNEFAKILLTPVCDVEIKELYESIRDTTNYTIDDVIAEHTDDEIIKTFKTNIDIWFEKTAKRNHILRQPLDNDVNEFNTSVLGNQDWLINAKDAVASSEASIDFSGIFPVFTNKNVEISGHNYNLVSMNDILNFAIACAEFKDDEEYDESTLRNTLEKCVLLLMDHINNYIIEPKKKMVTEDRVTEDNETEVIIEEEEPGDFWIKRISNQGIIYLIWIIFNIRNIELIFECISYDFNFFNTHLFMRCNNVRCIIISNACRQKPNSNYTESLQLAKETREFSTQNDDERDKFIFEPIRTENPYEDKLCEINSRVDDNSTLRKQIHRSKKKRVLGMGRGINQTNKNKKNRTRTRIKIIKRIRTRIRTRIRKNKTMKKLRKIIRNEESKH